MRADSRQYKGSASWRTLRSILADRFALALDHIPTETWLDWRGHRVHVDRYTPDEEAKGTLILVHGAGGHGRVLAPLGQLAVDLGWEAIAPDLPGYGLTHVRRGWKADYAEWPELIADLASGTEGPVVLMGLSVGGMTAVRAAQLAPKVSGVIATTLIDLADRETFVHAARWPWLGRLSLLLMRLPFLFDRLAFPLWVVTPLNKMTGDAALRRWFSRNRLIGQRWVSGRFFRTLHQHGHDFPNLTMHCPLLLVHPGADAWTPTSMSMPAFETASQPKHLSILSNGSHMPVEEPGRSELTAEVALFLEKIAD
jgi:alpha-beta hydrolase superfamily lysophospholipase